MELVIGGSGGMVFTPGPIADPTGSGRCADGTVALVGINERGAATMTRKAAVMVDKALAAHVRLLPRLAG